MKKHAIFSIHPARNGIKRSTERGVALVLTLAILSIVTLLVIAFAVSMRVENMASKNFNDLIKARELANAAVDQAVATIREATPVRNAPPLTWATFPGHVLGFDNAGKPTDSRLYSVPQVAGDNFDLNSDSSIVAVNAEFAARPAINAGWVYIAEDGSMSPPNALPLAKQLVGRFAFWVDDEASKVNINQAWTRGAANTGVTPDLFSTANAAYGDTSEVDLGALLANLNTFLPPINPSIVSARTAPNPPYATIEEVKRANVGIVNNDFTINKFYLTTSSDDANDLDVFGRTRLNISTLANPGDIDGTGGAAPPSAYARLSDPKLGNVCAGGVVVNGFANAARYSQNGLEQIIANIIAYQQAINAPAPPDAGGDPPKYLGLAKTPYINEVRVRYDIIAPVPPAVISTLKRTVTVELFYMYDDTYTPGGDTLEIKNLPVFGAIQATFTIKVPPADKFGTAVGAQRYRVYTDVENDDLPAGFAAGTPTIVVNYYRGGGIGGSRLDCSAVALPAIVSALANPGDKGWQGAEANDPCANEDSTIAGEWTTYIDPANGSLGAQNSTYPGVHDVTKAVMRGGNMQSIGELGFIHTPNSWQYLTLQPGGGAAAGQIPDWAMLDLFTVAGAKTTGRININSLVDANPAFAAGTRRTIPLVALLNGFTWGAPPTAQSVANNIYDDDNTVRAADNYGRQNVFDTIGELCEVTALANNKATAADREAVIRRIANLITVRSNTFTIWAIAQSIKDVNRNGLYNPPIAPPPGNAVGNDFITGEVRVKAVVERVQGAGVDGIWGNADDTVTFRTRYFRYIYD